MPGRPFRASADEESGLLKKDSGLLLEVLGDPSDLQSGPIGVTREPGVQGRIAHAEIQAKAGHWHTMRLAEELDHTTDSTVEVTLCAHGQKLRGLSDHLTDRAA